MRIKDLQDGMTVTCRTGRAGRTNVAWDGPWHLETLSVTRRQEDLPVKYRKNCTPEKWHKGDLLSLTILNCDTAEFGPEDFSPDEQGGVFTVEDFYLQIKDLEP